MAKIDKNQNTRFFYFRCALFFSCCRYNEIYGSCQRAFLSELTGKSSMGSHYLIQKSITREETNGVVLSGPFPRLITENNNEVNTNTGWAHELP